MYLCIGMCKGVQIPVEAGGTRSIGARVTYGHWKPNSSRPKECLSVLVDPVA